MTDMFDRPGNQTAPADAAQLTKTEAPVEGPAPNFTALDRCDDCNAQAWVKFEHPQTGHILLFCSHHAARYAPMPTMANFVIAADDREILIAQERAGGPAL